jgi:hypothetical protein
MPDTGVLTCSGEGSHILASGTIETIVTVQAELKTTTNPKLRILTTQVPRHIQYGGVYGFWVTGTDLAGSIGKHATTFVRHFSWEYEVPPLGPGNISADTLFWSLPAGLTLYIKASW